jgi:hypothetical protein
MSLNSVHAIIVFDEMQNGAIWEHVTVLYASEQTTILIYYLLITRTTDAMQVFNVIFNF